MTHTILQLNVPTASGRVYTADSFAHIPSNGLVHASDFDPTFNNVVGSFSECRIVNDKLIAEIELRPGFAPLLNDELVDYCAFGTASIRSDGLVRDYTIKCLLAIGKRVEKK